MRPAILNLNKIELVPLLEPFIPSGESASKYRQKHARVGRMLGSRKLGSRLIALEPGMRSSPFHSHRVNEEMFYILHGTGEIRIGAERFPVIAGDVIACPPGGPDTAHQIINTSSDELRYLAISTQESPDICEYPDSNKYMVMDSANAAEGLSRFSIVARERDAVDYWDGE
ncbi:cupin domain-containing protein [Pseudomonas sp. NPDC088368]|uniref:cupin domain-containing protein n=1 Tax=Pseudomonas sp. NPDC088368 TaxID=3364453 RepID=UPI00381B7D58